MERTEPGGKSMAMQSPESIHLFILLKDSSLITRHQHGSTERQKNKGKNMDKMSRSG